MVGISPNLVIFVMCTSVYKDKDTKPTFLKIKVHIQPLVQKFGYTIQKNTVIQKKPEGKTATGAKLLISAPRTTQERLLGAASPVPFTHKAVCLQSPEMECLPSVGCPLGFCLGDMCLRAEPSRSLMDHSADRGGQFLCWSLVTRHTNFFISREQQNCTVRSPECISNL